MCISFHNIDKKSCRSDATSHYVSCHPKKTIIQGETFNSQRSLCTRFKRGCELTIHYHLSHNRIDYRGRTDCVESYPEVQIYALRERVAGRAGLTPVARAFAGPALIFPCVSVATSGTLASTKDRAALRPVGRFPSFL